MDFLLLKNKNFRNKKKEPLKQNLFRAKDTMTVLLFLTGPIKRLHSIFKAVQIICKAQHFKTYQNKSNFYVKSIMNL